MNNPLDDPSLDPAIKDYLRRVSASVGKLPTERRDALLIELASHIEKLADEYREKGLQPDSATAEALKMMGDARKTGRSCAKTWYRANEPGSFLVAVGIASIIGTILGSFLQCLAFAILPGHMTPDQLAKYQALILVTRLFPGLSAGWYSPKGASIGAAAYASLMTANSLFIVYLNWSRAGTPHTAFHQEFGQMLQFAVLGPVAAYVSAAIAGRVRMYRYAGI
jgi:hypothetical protein